MKRTSLADVECPVARALDDIGDWWSLLIIRDAFDGLRRFGEFQKSLGISKGILTGRLKHLVAIGILRTTTLGDEGGYKEYILTPRGKGLFLVIVGLRQWGEDHCFEKAEQHSLLIEKANGHRVPRLTLRGRDGKEIEASATDVRKVVDLKGPRRNQRAVTN